MTRTTLGGIKILKNRAWLRSSSWTGNKLLPEICYRLAADRINISLLIYLSANENQGAAISLSVEEPTSLSSYLLLSQDHESTISLESEICILSVFPHHQKVLVPGKLIELMACLGVAPCGIASSPSAISAIIHLSDAEWVIDGLFDAFEISNYRSVVDWYAAYEGKEQVLKEIICSYQEDIIKVYDIVWKSGLDFWPMRVKASEMENFGLALCALEELHIKIPFVAVQQQNDGNYTVACCFEKERNSAVQKTLDEYLLECQTPYPGPTSTVYLHGPHFGDRFGIANALVESLQRGVVQPLAISCAVSSISLVVRDQDLARAIASLKKKFQIPQSFA